MLDSRHEMIMFVPDVAPTVEEDVLRLAVSVDDALLVEVAQPEQDFGRVEPNEQSLVQKASRVELATTKPSLEFRKQDLKHVELNKTIFRK